jgi:hypothetical protein
MRVLGWTSVPTSRCSNLVIFLLTPEAEIPSMHPAEIKLWAPAACIKYHDRQAIHRSAFKYGRTVGCDFNLFSQWESGKLGACAPGII